MSADWTGIAIVAAAIVLVAWRLKWTEEIGRLLGRHKSSGGKLVFDIDDYFFEPRIASREFIDAIRSQGMSEGKTSKLSWVGSISID